MVKNIGPKGQKGPAGPDGKVKIKDLLDIQKKNILASLKNLYGSNIKITDTDSYNISNSVVTAIPIKGNISTRLANNSTNVLTNLTNVISDNDDMKNTLVNQLSTKDTFIDILNNVLKSNNTYSKKIKGDVSDLINDDDKKRVLNPNIIWCEGGEFCQVPKNSIIGSYGIDLINSDAVEKYKMSIVPKYWGGKLSYTTTGTAGNSLLMEGVGTTQESGEGNLDRKVHLWDNMETGVTTMSNLLSGKALMSVGGNDTVPFGGYLELGGYDEPGNKIFISNIPVKNANGTYDNSWVRLIKDKGDPNSFSKGLVGSGFYATNDISARGVIATKNAKGELTASMSDGQIKIGNRGDNGKIGYAKFSDGVDIVGKGSVSCLPMVKIWDSLETSDITTSFLQGDSINVTTLTNGSVLNADSVTANELKIGDWKIKEDGGILKLYKNNSFVSSKFSTI